MKIYIVYEDDGIDSTLNKAFINKEKAQKYHQNLRDNLYAVYI